MTCRSAAHSHKTVRGSRTRLTPAQAATGQLRHCNAATGQLRHCNGPITHRTIAGLHAASTRRRRFSPENKYGFSVRRIVSVEKIKNF
eukprot:scaffold56421_cov68-Phaeocystis_antarctica.AAC.2